MSETRFLEEGFFGTTDLPPELTKRLRRVEKGNYDIELDGDRGLLMVVTKGRSLEQVQHALTMAGGLGIAQGSGRIVLWWYGQPSSSSQSTLSSCLH